MSPDGTPVLEERPRQWICNASKTQDGHGGTEPFPKTPLADNEVSKTARTYSTDDKVYAFRENYYDDYVETVWKAYSDKPALFNNQVTADKKLVKAGTDESVSKNGIVSGAVPILHATPGEADSKDAITDPSQEIKSNEALHKRLISQLSSAYSHNALLGDGSDIHHTARLVNSDSEAYEPSNHLARALFKLLNTGEEYVFSIDDFLEAQRKESEGISRAADPDELTVIVGK